MAMDQVMGMKVAVFLLAVIVDMFMDEIDPKQQVQIMKDIVGAADGLKAMVFGENGHLALQFVNQR
jgi:hypothetical protein